MLISREQKESSVLIQTNIISLLYSSLYFDAKRAGAVSISKLQSELHLIFSTLSVLTRRRLNKIQNPSLRLFSRNFHSFLLFEEIVSKCHLWYCRWPITWGKAKRNVFLSLLPLSLKMRALTTSVHLMILFYFSSFFIEINGIFETSTYQLFSFIDIDKIIWLISLKHEKLKGKESTNEQMLTSRAFLDSQEGEKERYSSISSQVFGHLQ